MPRFALAGAVALAMTLPMLAHAAQTPTYTLGDLADGKPVEGRSDLTYAWNGATWRFASPAHLDQFKADPAK